MLRLLILLPLLLSSVQAAKVAKQGDLVNVEYTGSLKDGRVFDSNVGKAPLQFTLGKGAMLADFEDAVLGLKEGESKTISIPTARAYGEFDEKKIVKFKAEQLPKASKVGDKVYYQNAKQNIPLRIVSIGEKVAFLDANHFLAGKDLNFEIRLVNIPSLKAE